MGVSVAVVAMLGACGSASGPAPVRVAGWAAGPVRWLLLPEERREIDGGGPSVLAVARFWERRGPGAEMLFAARVADADRLYGDEDRPGSLTDRGRALIVLGPPGHLRLERRTAPAWDANRPSGGPVRAVTTQLRVEVWGYLGRDLPVALCERLGIGPDEIVELSFEVRPGRVSLIENERLLELGARAWVRGWS